MSAYLSSATDQQAARRAIRDIARAHRDPALGPVDASLGCGAAGIAVFLYHLSRVDSEKTWCRAAQAYLESALTAAATVSLPVSLHTGFTGIAWSVAHLEREGLLTDGVDLSDVDDALIAHLEHNAAVDVLDVVFGLAGQGVYLIERLPARSAVHGLRLIIEALELRAERVGDLIGWFTPPNQLSAERATLYPRGLYDLGMAHGVPGILTFLSAAHQQRVGEERVRAMIDGGVRWLHRRMLGDDAGSAFAYWIPQGAGLEQPSSRLAWCYGDPGVGIALLAAARATGDPLAHELAVCVLSRSSARSLDRSGVVDGSVCHGSAGLVQMFQRAHRAIGAQRLASSAGYWIKTLLGQRDKSLGIAGFAYVHQDGPSAPVQRLAEQGLLQGTAGIGLVLLSALYPIESDWDRSLMLGFV